MPAMSRRAKNKPAVSEPSARESAREVLEWLERHAKPSVRAGMARYAIPSDNAYGVPVGELRKRARTLGRSHELAGALWDTGRYEARMLAAFVDEPERVTRAQMERWARDFDSWAVCDHVCFHLFDKTPHAFGRIEPWSRRRAEFVVRAAFGLLASLALHDRRSEDAAFLRFLPSIERCAADERNFVKKGVSWALRGIGCRSPKCHAAALGLAERLANSPGASQRWIGLDALRDLRRPLVRRRAEKRASSKPAGAKSATTAVRSSRGEGRRA